MDKVKARGPRIRIINILSLTFTALLLLLFVLASVNAGRARDSLEAAMNRFVESEMAAVALKQGSDNLTSQVRLYTVTADPAYLRAYLPRLPPKIGSERWKRCNATLAERKHTAIWKMRWTAPLN